MCQTDRCKVKIKQFTSRILITFFICISLIAVVYSGQALAAVSAPSVVADVINPTKGKVVLTATLTSGASKLQYMMKPDFNGDGRVSIGDLGMISAQFGSTDPAIIGKLDLNGDGQITMDDLTIVSNAMMDTYVNYTGPVSVYANMKVDFQAVDGAGSVSNVTTYTVVNIDRIPPNTPTFVADKTYPTNQNVYVTVSFPTDASVKEFQLGGTTGTWTVYSGPVVLMANTTVYARATDAVGNVSSIASFIVLNIDKTAPAIPTITPDNTTLTNGNVTTSISYSTESSIKEYSLNGLNWLAYTQPIVFTENGSIRARAVDSAGNISNETTYTVTNIDKIRPTAPTFVVDKTSPTNQNVNVTVNFSADASLKEYQLGSTTGTWTAYSGPIVVTANTTVYARATDAVGNVSSISSYAVLNIDKTAPENPTITPDKISLTNDNVIISISYSVDSVMKEYSQNEGIWLAYTQSVVFTANGTIRARSVDAAGNISNEAYYTASNIDKIAPTTPNIILSKTSWSNDPVTVSVLSGSDAGSGVKTNQYRLSTNGTWNNYNNPFAVSLVGQTTVYVRTLDYAGNISNEATATVLINNPISVSVPNTDTDEPNNSMSNASSIIEVKKSYLSTSGDVDYYRWTANATGKVQVTFNPPISKNYKLEVVKADSAVLASLSGEGSANVNVTSGSTYYVKIYGATSSDFGISSYTVLVGETDRDLNEPENNAIATAPSIGFSSTKIGFITSLADQDYFKFVTGTSTGKVKITLDMPGDANYYLGIYKPDGSQLTLQDLGVGVDESVFLPIQSGETYYLKVQNSGNSVLSSNSYTLSLGAVDVSNGEPNDTPVQATTIIPGTTYSNYVLGNSGDRDYFKFTASSSGKVAVKMSGPTDKNYMLYVQRGEGNRLDPKYVNIVSGVKTVQFDVQQGQTYFLAVLGATPNDFDAAKPYTFKVDAIVADDESNDSSTEAKTLTFGVPITSRISVAGDEDFYVLQRASTGLVNVKLDVSSILTPKDYDIQIYSEDGTRLVRPNKNSGENEEFIFTAQANKKYYVQVYGYKLSEGNYGTEPYTLVVTQQ